MRRFDGRVAIVTGAGQGIGQAVAQRLANEGAAVAVVDRNAATAADTVAALVGNGGQALAVAVDVGNREEIATMVPRVIDAFGTVDILVAAAGVHATTAFLDVAEADWDRIHAINLRGLFFCVQDVGRQMIAQGSGRIVTIASVAGRRGGPSSPHYAASKAGVISVTQSAALTFAPHGITVNAVCPGYVDTAMSRQSERDSVELGLLPEGERRRRGVAQIPLGRVTTPEEVAGLVAFLASDEAAYMTGQAIAFDGGWTMV